MNPYQAIVFDLGNVVFGISFDRTFQYWATAAGRSLAEVQQRFRFDELSDQFERGQISPAQFRAGAFDMLGFTLTDEQFDAGWNHLYLDVCPGINELLPNLKLRYRVAAFSNTNILHAPVWQVRYAETLRHFEKVYTSHEIGARKPEPEAFERVLSHMNLRPQEVLFLDDNPDNVAAASRLGMGVIHVTSAEVMMQKLKELKVVE